MIPEGSFALKSCTLWHGRYRHVRGFFSHSSWSRSVTHPPSAHIPLLDQITQLVVTPVSTVEPLLVLCTRGMTCKGHTEAAALELQDGVAAAPLWGTPHGSDKMDAGLKSVKVPAQSRDLLYYAQKMSGGPGSGADGVLRGCSLSRDGGKRAGSQPSC